jgi:hypothetical protein
VHRLAQATGARRLALAQVLQQKVGAGLEAWHKRVAPLAASAGGASSAPNLEGATEAQRSLQALLQQAGADAAQLRQEEGRYAAALQSLGQQLGDLPPG